MSEVVGSSTLAESPASANQPVLSEGLPSSGSKTDTSSSQVSASSGLPPQKATVEDSKSRESTIDSANGSQSVLKEESKPIESIPAQAEATNQPGTSSPLLASSSEDPKMAEPQQASSPSAPAEVVPVAPVQASPVSAPAAVALVAQGSEQTTQSPIATVTTVAPESVIAPVSAEAVAAPIAADVKPLAQEIGLSQPAAQANPSAPSVEAQAVSQTLGQSHESEQESHPVSEESQVRAPTPPSSPVDDGAKVEEKHNAAQPLDPIASQGQQSLKTKGKVSPPSKDVASKNPAASKDHATSKDHPSSPSAKPVAKSGLSSVKKPAATQEPKEASIPRPATSFKFADELLAIKSTQQKPVGSTDLKVLTMIRDSVSVLIESRNLIPDLAVRSSLLEKIKQLVDIASPLIANSVAATKNQKLEVQVEQGAGILGPAVVETPSSAVETLSSAVPVPVPSASATPTHTDAQALGLNSAALAENPSSSLGDASLDILTTSDISSSRLVEMRNIRRQIRYLFGSIPVGSGAISEQRNSNHSSREFYGNQAQLNSAYPNISDEGSEISESLVTHANLNHQGNAQQTLGGFSRQQVQVPSFAPEVFNDEPDNKEWARKAVQAIATSKADQASKSPKASDQANKTLDGSSKTLDGSSKARLSPKSVASSKPESPRTSKAVAAATTEKPAAAPAEKPKAAVAPKSTASGPATKKPAVVQEIQHVEEPIVEAPVPAAARAKPATKAPVSPTKASAQVKTAVAPKAAATNSAAQVGTPTVESPSKKEQTGKTVRPVVKK